MDDLDPLQTPKRGQPVGADTPSSWHKGRLRQLSPFSPVGVRRPVTAKKDDESEDAGTPDVETQKLHGHGKVTHRSEHGLPTSRKEGLVGKKAGEQGEVFSHLSTRKEESCAISRQRPQRDEDKGEKFRLSSSADVGRTRHEPFEHLSTSLRDDILSHQKITSRETVGTWSSKRATPADADQMLCRFDVIPEYGPCCGMSRRARWKLAEKLGLAPPKEVMEALVVSRKEVSIFDQRLAKFGVNPGHW